MHLHNHFETIHSAFPKTFTGAAESWRSMGDFAISEITYPSMYQTVTEGKFLFFDKKTFTHQISTNWELVFAFPLPILLKPWTLSFTKNTTTAKAVSQLMCLEERKTNEIYLANEGFDLAFFSMYLGDNFGSNVGNEDSVMLRAKGPNKLEFTNDIVRIQSLMLYTDLVEFNIIGNTRAPLLFCLPFNPNLKAGDIITTG